MSGSPSNQSTATSALLAVAIVVVLIPQATAAGEWVIRPASSTAFEHTPVLELEHPVLQARSAVAGGGHGISISGTTSRTSILEHHAERQEVWLEGRRIVGASYRETEVRQYDLEGGRFHLKNSSSTFAIVMQSEKASLHPLVEVATIEGVIESPMVKGAEYDGVFLPGEHGIKRANGSYLELPLGSYEATGVGAAWFYWFNSTLNVWTPDGSREFSARSWTESVGPAIVRRSIWYEAETTNATWSALKIGETATTVLASRLAVPMTKQVSVDATSTVLGDGAQTNGASVWLSGDLHASAFIMNEDSPAGYGISLSGDLRQYSIAGGAPQDILPAAAAGVAALALAVIVTVLVKLAVPLYTKLKKDKLLDIPSRDLIYKVIQQSPGIPFVELQKQVGTVTGTESPIAFGALAYHLSQMERFQLVVSKREGRFRRYFDVGAGIGADTMRIALLQTMPVTLLATKILESPGLTQGELHSRISPSYRLTRQSVGYHLRRLVDKDLVVSTEVGRFCKYRATERLERLATYLKTHQGNQPTPAQPLVKAAT